MSLDAVPLRDTAMDDDQDLSPLPATMSCGDIDDLGLSFDLENILESAKEHCCGKLEIICPCDKEDLSHLVHFLYDGEIHCNEEFDSIRILDNLTKIFGFPKNLG